MGKMTYSDNRITNNHNAKWYQDLADEYLAKFGRKSSGGHIMSCDTFKAWSYAPTRGDKQIEVVIDYAKQTITFTFK